MNPIGQLYWLRVILALIAASLSAILALISGASEATSINTLLNAIVIALAVYLASYYILRPKFSKVIEPQSKIMMTGIGIYFFTWLACFILFYTILYVVFIGPF